VPGFTATE